METLLVKQKNDFNLKQIDALEKGKLKRERMILLVRNAVQNLNQDKYGNLYIYSLPGLGKSFTVNGILEISDIPHTSILGNTSMFAFGISLAVTSYLNPEKRPIVIHVDDCDEIFKNEPNCNTMKKLLDAECSFVYEKSLASQLPYMSDLQRTALEHFGREGKLGFEVPVHNFRFIFTSNIQLPTDDEVFEARRKSKTRAILMAHRNAIRSRCKVGDFNLSWEEHWGWLADVLINTNCLCNENLTDNQKEVILNFLWNNWFNLTERSIRLIEKMAITMRQFPDTYKIIWEIDYLKIR
jgi:hypothetical protein